MKKTRDNSLRRLAPLTSHTPPPTSGPAPFLNNNERKLRGRIVLNWRVVFLIQLDSHQGNFDAATQVKLNIIFDPPLITPSSSYVDSRVSRLLTQNAYIPRPTNQRCFMADAPRI